MRGELPDQSARAHGAASPCGNLELDQHRVRNIRTIMEITQRLTVMRNLIIVFDCLFVGKISKQFSINHEVIDSWLIPYLR